MHIETVQIVITNSIVKKTKKLLKLQTIQNKINNSAGSSKNAIKKHLSI